MRLGLLGRTVAALLAVGLVPLAVVPVLIGLNRQALRDQVLRSHALAARTVTTQVSALLDALRVPARALASDPAVAADPRSPQTRNLLADAPERGHVFNLGHGVLPSTDPGMLTELVGLVHEITEKRN